MKLVDNVVRRKLSRALGAPVSFDGFKASLLGGTLDVEGLTIGGGAGGGAGTLPPLVHVRRTLAHISLGRALMREVAVRSLTLERPVVRIVRTAGGETNLPRPARRAAAAAEDVAEEGDDGEGSAGRWAFECEKVLLVDGEVHVDVQGRVPYRLSVVGLVGELRRTAEGDYDVTLIADAVRATHEEVALGEFKAHGKIAGAADLSRLAQASVNLDWNLGALLRGRVEAPSLGSRGLSGLVEGSLQAPMLLALLPVVGVGAAALSGGQLEFRVEGSYSPADGVRIGEGIVRAAGVRIGF